MPSVMAVMAVMASVVSSMMTSMVSSVMRFNSLVGNLFPTACACMVSVLAVIHHEWDQTASQSTTEDAEADAAADGFS